MTFGLAIHDILSVFNASDTLESLMVQSQIEVTLDFETLPFPPFVFGAALQMFFNALISYDRFMQLRIRERGRDEPFAIFPTIHGGRISG